ncbi:hypothetical protein VNO77_11551 [Canavalia gladiata]|uniref:NAC domain-containing protein n=1 Tax=Canavalia gladiata TaxID=3824 RepID=A0AAN9QXR3_CANGL
MLAMEELLCELSDHEKRNEQGLPPGFRFHPTDEELLTFYLASKVFNGTFTNVKFAEVDLNRCEPWELPEVAKMGEREWYLFSLRDRKYPTGLRTNRATGAGYWKATGKDKEVYSGSSGSLLGMKKTLVFYKGRAPRGEKTKWVMHEYRLDAHFSLSHPHSSKEEWVICRIFHKSGEKRNSLLQLKGQLDASSSQNSSHSQPDFQTPLLIYQHQNDLSHTPHLFPLQPSFPIRSSFSDLFFKSHLSQQNSTLKDQTLPNPKLTKTDPTTSFQYQLLDDANSFRWMDKFNPNPNPNPNPTTNFQNSIPLHLDADADAGFMPFSGAANLEFRDMSTASSIAFHRVGLMQQVLDAPIGIDSWPQAQHA